MAVIVGKLSYNCVKCDTPVVLDVTPKMFKKKTVLWTKLFDSKVCLDCHCDSKVPEVTECILM